MARFNSQVTKKWLKYAMINIIIFSLLYGTMIVGYAYFTLNARTLAGQNELKAYAELLAGQSPLTLKKVINGENAEIKLVSPSCSFALYLKREDGTLEYLTDDPYLLSLNDSVGLSTNFDEFREQTIGDYNYSTYSTRLADYDGAYVKVFMSLKTNELSLQFMLGWTVVFAILFFIISVVASVGIGYLQIKPLVSTYEKQKDFINDMSHEIRTPLTIIRGNIENIRANPNSTISETNVLLDETLKEVEYMTDMSSGLLNIVRNGNKSLTKAEGGITEIISDVVEVYSDLTSCSGKSLIANVEQVDMRVDKEKIKQLLVILMENAIKYTKETDKIKIKLKKTKTGCIISVSDTGVGVKEDDLTKIFERFYRSENAKNIEGTGLGLAIAKSIVESLGGVIYARLNIPKGLSIIVELNDIK